MDRLYFVDPPAAWNVVAPQWRSRLTDNGALVRADAQELLEHPDRWVGEEADGHASLCQSTAGKD
jgi:hypothetical protein